MELTKDEQACAERCKKVWDEAVITYQLPEDIKFVLMFSDNLQMRERWIKSGGRKGITPVATCKFIHTSNKILMVLNRDAIKQNPENMLEDSIPHEVAHAVCFIKPYLGYEHDHGWQAIAKRLGGTGRATYNDEYDMRQRKRRKFIYQVPELGKVLLSDVRHKRLQAGGLAYRARGMRITKEHFTGETVL